jgi:predicted cupin superfamily sugar epimerase
MNLTAERLIELLGLQPLPGEGGWYRETHRAALTLPASVLPAPYTAPHAGATAIYYLLTPDSFSALHRLPTDEVYHFYLGDPVEMLLLAPGTGGRRVVLGPDLLAGQQPQFTVPAGAWQGSRLRDAGAFALLGTTMSPGFDFADFEAGERSLLTANFPDFAGEIERLTPSGTRPRLEHRG